MDLKPYMQDSAAEGFFSRLGEGLFQTTRCRNCGETHFPPRVVCPYCLGDDLEWVDLPRTGRLVAFTQQAGAAFRCMQPDVLGIVGLDGVGNIFTRIDAPYEELGIGLQVEFEPYTAPDGVILHQFKPC